MCHLANAVSKACNGFYMVAFLPCTNYHAGNSKQLQPSLRDRTQSQVAVYTTHCHVQRKAGEILHRGHLHEPVDQDVPGGRYLS